MDEEEYAQLTNAVITRTQAISRYIKLYTEYLQLRSKGNALEEQGINLPYKDQERLRNLDRLIE